VHRVRGLYPQQAVYPDLQGVVGDDRQDARSHPGGTAKSQGDVGVEGAGSAGEFGHRHKAHREDQQNRARRKIGGRGADPTHQDGQRSDPSHHRQRRSSGHHQENDAPRAERIGFEVLGRGTIADFSGRGGRRHGTLLQRV